MNSVKSFCRNCIHTCGLEVKVENGKIAEMQPDREHPLTKGYVCIKAGMSIELQNGGDGRLNQSLKRQDDGSYVPIDNDQAIDEIAAKLKDIIETYGPQSVAMYTGTGSHFNSLAYPLSKALMAAIGSKNWFSSMTIDQSAIWVTMSRMGFMASGKPVPTDVKTLLVAGNNPAQSHYMSATPAPRRSLLQFQKDGGNLIVIDPRATEITSGGATHLAVKPGEDATLFAGMIRLILANDWHDKDFCDRFVDGLESLKACVEPYTPEYVEQRAGIPADQLLAATELFATAESALAVGSTGICMGPHSNLNHHLMECLNAICGNYRKAGDVVKNPGVLFPRPAAETVVPSNRGWETGVKCHSTDIGLLFGEMPTGALPDAILTPGEGKIRALINWAGNPAKALGQPDKTLRAFDDLDLLVSIDPRMNETAELSDYVIAPTMPYERYDLTTIGELGGFGKPFVQCATPVIEPPAGAMKETDFFWDVARRLGKTLTYKKLGIGLPFEMVRGGHEMAMDTPPDDLTLVQWWCEGNGIDYDELMAAENGLVLDLPETRVAEVPQTEDSPRLQLCPDDVASELQAVVAESIDDGDFRYRLVTRRLLEAMNSAYRDTVDSTKRFPVNFAYMNPEDIEAEGLATGDSVRVASEYGELETLVRPDKGLRRGVIAMAHCWGRIPIENGRERRGGFTGNLVTLDDHIEPINHMPRQTAIPVNVFPA
ncbi:MAG: molybdopterin-containing oxidoreductase family protein [bacterium]